MHYAVTLRLLEWDILLNTQTKMFCKLTYVSGAENVCIGETVILFSGVSIYGFHMLLRFVSLAIGLNWLDVSGFSSLS